jgi:hypothetical protein
LMIEKTTMLSVGSDFILSRIIKSRSVCRFGFQLQEASAKQTVLRHGDGTPHLSSVSGASASKVGWRMLI